MKHNIIKTEKYLLVVDDSEIKEGDYRANIQRKTVHFVDEEPSYFNRRNDVFKKITAHLPLNNSPVLEGVPLLPPLEDGVEKLAKEFATKPLNPSNPTGTITDLSLQLGFKSGYNKAKEKYAQLIEKQISDFRHDLRESTSNHTKQNCEGALFGLKRLKQSLQQPKMPVAFECEEIYCGYMEDEALMKPKTTTNPQGQTEWVGKYIY
jgi:hypothetical protein